MGHIGPIKSSFQRRIELRIVITGGAGFIGSHIANRYLYDGHDVEIIDNFSTGRMENIPQGYGDFAFYRMDIMSDIFALYFKDSPPDVVSHHAALANLRASVDDPGESARINILGTIRMLELCRKYGVKRFIFASTAGPIYGDMSGHGQPFDESFYPHPSCPYGVSKLAAEQYIQLYSDLYGLPFVIFRYPNVYGPRQIPASEAGVVTIFARAMLRRERPTIFGDGSKTRDYVYVDDIVEANALALTKGEGGVYNLGSRIETSDQEIFDAVREAVGSDIKPIYCEKRPGEIDRYCLDWQRAYDILGWRPLTTLQDGISKTVGWCREEGW
jgi:UDP-glucose 4-epimerase